MQKTWAILLAIIYEIKDHKIRILEIDVMYTIENKLKILKSKYTRYQFEMDIDTFGVQNSLGTNKVV